VVHVAPLLGALTQAEPAEGHPSEVAPSAGNEATGESGGHEVVEAQPDNPILPTGPELAWGAASFLLLWALMKFVLLKPIISTMEQRAERIEHDLRNAEELKTQAAASLADYEASLASARTEASAIIDGARSEAEEERRAVLAAAEAEASELRAQAGAEVAEAKAEALRSMRASVVTIAVQAAELVVQKRLDEGAQRAIVEEYLNRASQN
jgi:F-type H+-transporting ATPase subunit b